jgi:hypothetical protein
MKTFGRILGSLWIAGTLLSVPAHSGAGSLGAMRVSIADRDVQVRIPETGEWAPVSINMPLVEGDELWVPHGSRAALQTSNGAYVRLGGGTAVQVLRMDRDSFQLYLAQGHAYVLSLAPQRSVLQLDTPDASIRAFGSATFRADVLDGWTDVSVLKGSVLAESDAGTTKVPGGGMLALGPHGYAELSPLPPPDDWERWNADRDRIVLARGESHRRLPAELRMYASDFDGNGRWVYVQGYGYCWTPTVVVIGDWAPYRHGRWVWRGGDYVWIGYEPWGWTPYHYGRWAFVARIGWVWVPPPRGEVFWGPGYVGWVRTPEHVAWVPLAPREIYYGYGNYGRYSVNVTNVTINNIHVTNVYRNAKVVNSVTVVHHTTFVTGRAAPVNRNVVVTAREDFARRRNIVAGRPQIRPVETSYVPVVRPIPEPSRPPAAVRKVDASELRRSRPLVKEPDRSALRPEGRSRPLEARKVEKPKPVSERIREREQPRPTSPRGPGDREGGPPQGLERGPERGRPPEGTVERLRLQGPQNGRVPAEERGRPQGPPADDRVRPEQPRGGPPERSGERENERDVGLRQAPKPEKEPSGSHRVVPERAVERRVQPAPGSGGKQAPPASSNRAEGSRKASSRTDAKPNPGDSEGNDERGEPERPSGHEERRDRR